MACLPPVTPGNPGMQTNRFDYGMLNGSSCSGAHFDVQAARPISEQNPLQ
jgi:hypothetical protein